MSSQLATRHARRTVGRRDVLRLGAAALATLGINAQLYAAPPRGPRFLLVFLRGGYDCASVLVPYSSADYYEGRPTLAIPRPDPAITNGALALDANWALAPALRANIGKLYQQGQAAFVPFCGTDDLSRSHFETQDSIELGQPLGGSRNYRSGFMARLAGVLTGAASSRGQPEAISFTDTLPLAFQGPGPVANLSLRDANHAAFDERQSRVLSQMYAGRSVQGAVSEGLELRREVAQMTSQEMQAANRNASNPRGFEQQAERVGALMRDRYRIGFIDVGGWDTHVNEGAATGALANNLTSLGNGVANFAQALGDEWRNTVVVVLSEFGRTFRENGNRGTDHGHGSVYWVLGGAIRGGRVVGEQRPVTRANLFQDRDYPVLNDYRAVLGGLFRAMWSLSAAQSATVFSQAQPVDLRLV